MSETMMMQGLKRPAHGSFSVYKTEKRLLIHGVIPIEELAAITNLTSEWIVLPGIGFALGATLAACHKDELAAWESEIDRDAAIKASHLADDEQGAAELTWLFGRDTGLSSLTIFSVLSKHEIARQSALAKIGRRGSLPRDPEDFGRCHRLLECFPAWRERLPEVAECFPGWKALINAWEELTSLYLEELPIGKCPKLYDRMQKLQRTD